MDPIVWDTLNVNPIVWDTFNMDPIVWDTHNVDPIVWDTFNVDDVSTALQMTDYHYIDRFLMITGTVI